VLCLDTKTESIQKKEGKVLEQAMGRGGEILYAGLEPEVTAPNTPESEKNEAAMKKPEHGLQKRAKHQHNKRKHDGSDWEFIIGQES